MTEYQDISPSNGCQVTCIICIEYGTKMKYFVCFGEMFPILIPISTSVYNYPKYLASSPTEIEPQTAITNQTEESKEKI